MVNGKSVQLVVGTGMNEYMCRKKDIDFYLIPCMSVNLSYYSFFFSFCFERQTGEMGDGEEESTSWLVQSSIHWFTPKCL